MAVIGRIDEPRASSDTTTVLSMIDNVGHFSEIGSQGVSEFMNVNLTDRLEEFVRDKVDSGLYNSASEVVRDALRLLEEQDQFRKAKLEALRGEIQKGLDSGPSAPLDMGVIKAKARKLFEAERAR